MFTYVYKQAINFLKNIIDIKLMRKCYEINQFNTKLRKMLYKLWWMMILIYTTYYVIIVNKKKYNSYYLIKQIEFHLPKSTEKSAKPVGIVRKWCKMWILNRKLFVRFVVIATNGTKAISNVKKSTRSISFPQHSMTIMEKKLLSIGNVGRRGQGYGPLPFNK